MMRITVSFENTLVPWEEGDSNEKTLQNTLEALNSGNLELELLMQDEDLTITGELLGKDPT